MQCPNPDCREAVPDYSRYCLVCGADAQVPNVRAVNRRVEVEALEQRVVLVEKDARSRGAEKNLAAFRNAVASSSAVICKSLSKVSELVSSDNQLFTTFYKQVRSNSLLPEDNEWDRIRQPVDSLLFPFFFEELLFAVLSLDGTGVSGYGPFCITIKENSIKDRASVFEENTILFITRHHLVAGDPLPFGYRASWSNRSALALAKLGHRLTSSTAPKEYQSILVSSTATTGDFIEVHIYGPLHRRAIEHVAGRQPRSRADRVILNSVRRKLKELGATCTIQS